MLFAYATDVELDQTCLPNATAGQQPSETYLKDMLPFVELIHSFASVLLTTPADHDHQAAPTFLGHATACIQPSCKLQEAGPSISLN